MLTRNCVPKLFRPDDFNARVTVFSKTPRYYQPLAYKNAWLETIRNSLGKGVVNNTDSNFIEIVASNGGYCNGFMTGNQLMDRLQRDFHEPTSIRISFHGWPTRSWIIILERELTSQDN